MFFDCKRGIVPDAAPGHGMALHWLGMEPAYVVIPDLAAEESGAERKVRLASGSSWRIGRREENDIALPSHRVSRQHALIQLSAFMQPGGQPGPTSGQSGGAPGYYLIDMGSRNGSFVNGKRVSVPVQLHDGDLVTVGDRQLTFHCSPPESAPDRGGPDETLQTGEIKTSRETEAYFSDETVTVLVVDVRNFTALSQSLEQAVLCQVIGTLFKEGGAILQARQSWAQKYIGDAIMSVWVHRDGRQAGDFQEILRALLEIEELTSKLQARFGLSEPIRIGAGVNTGLASIGNTGSAEQHDYTALGDTVNAAFRYESATKEAELDVMLGPAAFAALKQIAPPGEFFASRTLPLKGYRVPAALWGATFADLRQYVASVPVSGS